MLVDAAFDVGVIADDADLTVFDVEQFLDSESDALLTDLHSVVARRLLGDTHGVIVADDVAVAVNGDVVLEQVSLFRC